MAEPRLQISGVHFSYPGTDAAALAGIELQLEPGCCLGLIGPNGAGKSTLLRLAGGLLKPSSGEVHVSGQPISSLKPRERGQLVAYVPQTFSLPFTFTVLEIVLQGRHPHMGRATFETQRDLDIAQSAMERTGTWHLRDRHLDALSGGERQRAVIAAALAQEPKLLILDEPTSSLDLHFQNTAVRLVRALVEEGLLSVLVALHDLSLASSMCDELALLVEGELRAAGPPEDVLTRELLEGAYNTDLHVGEGPRGIYVLPLP